MSLVYSCRWIAAACLAVLVSSSVLAASLPMHEPDSVIYLTKNTNGNQVHYGVKLEEDCTPSGKKPVYAYWRMLEKGHSEQAGLMFWEQPGYGVKQSRNDEEELAFVIRGVPERSIRLETHAREEGCAVRAYTMIDGVEALFQRIDIEVSGWANVHRVEIHGLNPVDGSPVSEVTHSDAP